MFFFSTRALKTKFFKNYIIYHFNSNCSTNLFLFFPPAIFTDPKQGVFLSTFLAFSLFGLGVEGSSSSDRRSASLFLITFLPNFFRVFLFFLITSELSSISSWSWSDSSSLEDELSCNDNQLIHMINKNIGKLIIKSTKSTLIKTWAEVCGTEFCILCMPWDKLKFNKRVDHSIFRLQSVSVYWRIMVWW